MAFLKCIAVIFFSCLNIESKRMYRILSFCVLRHTVGELGTADNVEVKVLHRLASVFTYVADYSVSVIETERYCETGNNGKNVSDNVCIVLVYLVDRGDMCLGHYEEVNGSLRVNVEESIALVVLVYLL